MKPLPTKDPRDTGLTKLQVTQNHRGVHSRLGPAPRGGLYRKRPGAWVSRKHPRSKGASRPTGGIDARGIFKDE